MIPPYGVSLQHMVQLLVNKISYEQVSYEMSYGFFSMWYWKAMALAHGMVL